MDNGRQRATKGRFIRPIHRQDAKLPSKLLRHHADSYFHDQLERAFLYAAGYEQTEVFKLRLRHVEPDYEVLNKTNIGKVCKPLKSQGYS